MEGIYIYTYIYICMLVFFVRKCSEYCWPISRNFPGADVVYKRKQFGMAIWYHGSGAAMRRDLKHSKPLDPEQKPKEKWRFQKKTKDARYNFPNYMKETWVPMEWTIQRKNRAGMEVSLKGIPAYTWWSIVGHLASCANRIPIPRVFGPPCDSLDQKEDFTWIQPKSMQKTRSNHRTMNKRHLITADPWNATTYIWFSGNHLQDSATIPQKQSMYNQTPTVNSHEMFFFRQWSL